jgi:hypothetical protein
MATPKKKSAAQAASVRWPFGMRNYIVFGASLIAIIVGYILLSQGSITAAPVLLVIGYCVLLPIAIIVRPDREGGEAETEVEPTA